ncbi:uncharacterized protein BDZ99DRAFT_459854 [Mytilinidion resinicola]|uniref:Uncharacterized protein n=1 Tax=Mytilinidion resinicola TaxID=574789 RepID=A0A6A6Z1I3_9PEZI|nr:uncharacterized protein BDZ99DRAFT_459854 [Mytilinidion resinicola]KAF2814144.1 hypothetical protein BDZ99DRAFT_459854 [Mytilinidion resinicola]
MALKDPQKTVKASDQAIDAAKKSDLVKRIVKSETFQDCVALGATLAATEAGNIKLATHDVPSWNTTTTTRKHRRQDLGIATKLQNVRAGDYYISIDLDAAPMNHFPSPAEQADQTIVMVADPNTDAQPEGNPSINIQTWPDNYNRNRRVVYQTCSSIESNDITLMQVWGGCCKFYDDEKCSPDTSLFSMTNRQDGQLKGKDNDSISSFWCTFDLNCAGAP